MTDAKEFAYIGDKITKLRKEKGWTQAELSCRSGVKGSAINRIVKAGHTPSLTLLTKLAKAFKVDICDLIYDATERDIEAAEFYRQYGSILSLSDSDKTLVRNVINRLEPMDSMEIALPQITIMEFGDDFKRQNDCKESVQ